MEPLRITIDGKAAEISAKRYIDPRKWDIKAYKALGNGQETITLNVYLKTLEQQVYDVHYLMLKEEDFVTAESLKSKLLGTDVSTRILIPIFQDHNDRKRLKVGFLGHKCQMAPTVFICRNFYLLRFFLA